MPHNRSRNNRLPVLPYAFTMKSYAYAKKSFSYAMEQLGYFYLEVPRKDVESHNIYWEILEGMYQGYRREARKLSPKYEFTKGQIKALGLDPFYTWIMEEEDPSASNASAFVQDIVDEMRNFRLRQVVSVLLRLGEPPEAIHEQLRKLGFTNWMVEHITFYNRFFWNIAPMRYEDWLNYLYFANPYPSQRTDEDGVKWKANPHFSYLKSMATMESAESLRFKCGLPPNTSLSEMEEDLQLNLGQMIKETMRNGDCKNTAKLLSPFIKMSAARNSGDSSSEVDEEIIETLKNMRVIATPYQAKKYGVNMADLGYVGPLPAGSIKGEISDPRAQRKPPKPPEEKEGKPPPRAKEKQAQEESAV